MAESTSPSTSGYALLALSFFVGFIGVLGYRYIRTPKHELPPASTAPITTMPEPTFTLAPPSQAVSGDLTVINGKADIFTRTADAYAEASPTAKILVGESVNTKEQSSATVNIPSIVTVAMDEKTEITFANLYPDNMVLLQKAGSATYTLLEGMKPVSIRALHNLIALESGEMTITMNDTDISVTVTAGVAKLAQVDSDNTTHVWDIKERERAIVDDELRQVRILKAR